MFQRFVGMSWDGCVSCRVPAGLGGMGWRGTVAISSMYARHGFVSPLEHFMQRVFDAISVGNLGLESSEALSLDFVDGRFALLGCL